MNRCVVYLTLTNLKTEVFCNLGKGYEYINKYITEAFTRIKGVKYIPSNFNIWRISLKSHQRHHYQVSISHPWCVYIYIYIYIYIPTLCAFFKMSHIKIKRKDIHKILSYISTLYEFSTD